MLRFVKLCYVMLCDCKFVHIVALLVKEAHLARRSRRAQTLDSAAPAEAYHMCECTYVQDDAFIWAMHDV